MSLSAIGQLPKAKVVLGGYAGLYPKKLTRTYAMLDSEFIQSFQGVMENRRAAYKELA